MESTTSPFLGFCDTSSESNSDYWKSPPVSPSDFVLPYDEELMKAEQKELERQEEEERKKLARLKEEERKKKKRQYKQAYRARKKAAKAAKAALAQQAKALEQAETNDIRDPPGCFTESTLAEVRLAACFDTHYHPKLTREDSYKDLVFVIDNFLSSKECDAFREVSTAVGFKEAKHAASAEVALRNNGRLAVKSTKIAARIYARLNKLLPDLEGKLPTRCNPNIRLYRYVPGQSFGKHVDESVYNSINGHYESTEFTCLVYLCDAGDSGLAGGETKFYAGWPTERLVLSYKPKKGSLLLHAHGFRCLTHEGAPVTAGEKYLLRTDVFYLES